jgi:hypothetical protein
LSVSLMVVVSVFTLASNIYFPQSPLSSYNYFNSLKYKNPLNRFNILAQK